MNKEKLKQIKEKLNKAPKGWTNLGGEWIRTYDGSLVDKLLNEVIDAVLEEEKEYKRGDAFNNVMKTVDAHFRQLKLKEYMVKYEISVCYEQFPTNDTKEISITNTNSIMAKDFNDAYKMATENFDNIKSIVEVK